MLKRLQLSRGDTLIEVLFAVSVFSLVAVGAISIMNQGSALSERALETTLVRQEIDAQAETLRFLHDSYVATYQPGETFDSNQPITTPSQQWQAMVATIENVGATSATPFGNATTCPVPSTINGAFIMDTRNAAFISSSQGKLQSADSYAQVTYNTVSGNQVMNKASGIWIEGIRSATNTTDPYQAHLGYIDFHISACWYGPGQSDPMTIGTIVRLYEPR